MSADSNWIWSPVHGDYYMKVYGPSEGMNQHECALLLMLHRWGIFKIQMGEVNLTLLASYGSMVLNTDREDIETPRPTTQPPPQPLPQPQPQPPSQSNQRAQPSQPSYTHTPTYNNPQYPAVQNPQPTQYSSPGYVPSTQNQQHNSPRYTQETQTYTGHASPTGTTSSQTPTAPNTQPTQPPGWHTSTGNPPPQSGGSTSAYCT